MQVLHHVDWPKQEVPTLPNKLLLGDYLTWFPYRKQKVHEVHASLHATNHVGHAHAHVHTPSGTIIYISQNCCIILVHYYV